MKDTLCGKCGEAEATHWRVEGEPKSAYLLCEKCANDLQNLLDQTFIDFMKGEINGRN